MRDKYRISRIAVFILALGFIVPTTGNADDPIICPPSISGGTITEKVLVPPGQSCTITGAEIRGNIELGDGASLTINGGSLAGNVECVDGESVTLNGVDQTGNVDENTCN